MAATVISASNATSSVGAALGEQTERLGAVWIWPA